MKDYFSSVGGFPVYGTTSADVNNADNDKNLELTVSAEDNGVLIYHAAISKALIPLLASGGLTEEGLYILVNEQSSFWRE